MAHTPEHSAQTGPPSVVQEALANLPPVSALPQEREPTIAGPYESRPKPDGGYIAQPSQQTKSEFLSSLVGMDPETRREFERQLFVMGFYPGGTNFDAVQASSRAMPDTLVAAERFFAWASSVGDGRTPWDVLAQEASDEMVGMNDASIGGRQGSAIQLQDPVGIGALLERTYTQMVGKAPTDAEKRAFVATIHSMQRGQQKAINEARFGAQVEVTGVDVGAQAQEFAEQERPNEVGGQRAIQATNTLRNLTQRGVGG